MEKTHKAEVIAFKDKQIAERRERKRQRAEKRAQREMLLASLDRVKNVEDVTNNMTVKQLDDQLEIYRKLVDSIPQKSKLRNKSLKIETLKNAIRDFSAQDTDEEDTEGSEEEDVDVEN